MQTVEMYFNEKIEKYRQLKQDTFILIEDIPLLSPIELGNRCDALSTQQREIIQDHEHLCLIMEDIGPEILNTAYIGEYQRALDKSILACDILHAEIHSYKNRMHALP
jgi:hypothetical protein